MQFSGGLGSVQGTIKLIVGSFGNYSEASLKNIDGVGTTVGDGVGTPMVMELVHQLQRSLLHQLERALPGTSVGDGFVSSVHDEVDTSVG